MISRQAAKCAKVGEGEGFFIFLTFVPLREILKNYD